MEHGDLDGFQDPPETFPALRGILRVCLHSMRLLLGLCQLSDQSQAPLPALAVTSLALPAAMVVKVGRMEKYGKMRHYETVKPFENHWKPNFSRLVSQKYHEISKVTKEIHSAHVMVKTRMTKNQRCHVRLSAANTVAKCCKYIIIILYILLWSARDTNQGNYKRKKKKMSCLHQHNETAPPIAVACLHTLHETSL